VTTRLWSFFQAAAQDSPATYGIAPELYAPGGWKRWRKQGIRGSAPGDALSDWKVPLIVSHFSGQVPGAPTECRVSQLPTHFLYELICTFADYQGDLVLHCGAFHNSRLGEEDVAIEDMQHCGLDAMIAVRDGRGLQTIWCQDAWGEATPEKLSRNIYGGVKLSGRGFDLAKEGGTPTRYAGIMPVRLNLWQRSALMNMVNNPKAREGIAPPDPNVENVVWIDDATLATPEEHVFAAEQVKAGGVLDTAPRTVEMYGINWTVADGKPDAFQQSAARPLSAAISVGMDGAKVREIWGNGAA